MDIERNCLAKILVVGVGGGGNNAVNNMIKDGVKSCTYIAMNTDMQALVHSLADDKLQLGRQLTKGLGAGSDPSIGERAANESIAEIEEKLKGTDLLFIAAGMGGGTGTGAAPVIAQLAKNMDILTIAVVTKPFDFEGKKRAANANIGIEKLRKYVDTLLVIPNQKLMEQHESKNQYSTDSTKRLSLKDAFKIADDVLKQGIQGIADLIVKPAYVNLDFADVRTVIKDKGIAHMGIGVGKGERRHIDAANQAVSSALLETRIEGATALILNFVGSEDVSVSEIGEACTLISEVVDADANILFGFAIDENMRDELHLTVVATGFVEYSGLGKRSSYGKNAQRLFDEALVGKKEEQVLPDSTEKPITVQPEPPTPVAGTTHAKKTEVSDSRLDVGSSSYVPPFLRKLRKKDTDDN